VLPEQVPAIIRHALELRDRVAHVSLVMTARHEPVEERLAPGSEVEPLAIRRGYDRLVDQRVQRA
jgi:hypothetical protein